MLTYILIPIGFVLLIKGADYLVDGASSIARRFGISSLVIGLTIVSFGTSAPELIVNIFASIQGNTDIAIGNILGSNIANILLILGVSAIIFPLAVKRSTIWKEIPFSLLAVAVLGFMANDALFDGKNFSEITLSDGLTLIGFFVIFLYYTFGMRKAEPADESEPPAKQQSAIKSSIMVIVGLIGLTLGGKWIVNGAVTLATLFNISEAVIGLTIIAIGTSLPELATSAVAAYKKDTDIAVGNIVGSNIFNIFWILGLTAVIKPLPFSTILLRDLLITIIATTLLFFFMFVGKKHILEKWQGISFVVLYIAYITFLVIQEISK